MFKVGDLVKLNMQFSPDRHPPVGTHGIVIDVELWDIGQVYDSNGPANDLVDVEQFVKVHWAHENNSNDQTYLNSALRLACETGI